MRNQKRLYPTKYYIRLLTFLVFSAFVRFYRIKKILPQEVKRLKPPYLLLGNHVGHWDPFLIGHWLPHFTHFVSSDAAFKTKVAGFFLPRLGAIPKQKNVRDSRAVRAIAGVIRQGDNVGIFPEAVRTWTGSTLPIDPSIGKLVKMLKVPVVASVSRGMHLFNPRWSKKVRNTPVEIEYQLILDAQQVVQMDPDAIHQTIVKALEHDEVEYQKERRHVIRSRRRAEHINHALFVCPECTSLDSFATAGNDFWCKSCDYTLQINPHGFFQLKKGERMHFDNIRDWYDWQEKWLVEHVTQHLQRNDPGMLFQDLQSVVYHGDPEGDLKRIGIADVRLFPDRIELFFSTENRTISLKLEELLTINPQVHEKLEIGYPGADYRCIGGRPGVSGLKWEIAVNVIWKQMGHMQKLSPYVKLG